jgi:hypothetical protein
MVMSITFIIVHKIDKYMYRHFKRRVVTIQGEWLIDFTPNFNGGELYYSVKISDVDGFRMTKDESGMWKIAAQGLPAWVHEMDLELNDIIEDQVENHITAEALVTRGFDFIELPRKYYRLDTPTYTIAIVYSDDEWKHYIRPWEETPVTILYSMHDVERILANAP